MTRPSTPINGAAAALLLIALAATADAQARPAAPQAAAAPVLRPAPSSWTTDTRELRVGDIITVYINDAVIASARKSQSGRDNTDRDLGFSLATPGAEPTSATFGDGKRASSDQSGDMSRTSALATTVSVRIVSRTPDGAYSVKGTRSLNVDKNQQDIAVEGLLRPQDVSVNNEADGDRLANAKIVVTQKGRLGKTRGGIVGRILGLVWP